MDAKAFFQRFGQLHEQFRRGSLPPGLREEYNFFCASLTQMMLAAQQMQPNPGTNRGALRMAKVLKAEIEFEGKKEKTATIDLGQSGFAAVLSQALPIRTKVQFMIQLPLQPITGLATVVTVRPQSGAHRHGFSFDNLPQNARDALQVTVIDSVLERVGGQVRG